MNKQDLKLQEAKYFYDQMLIKSLEGNLTELQFAVSSFINAGRSVLQYTHTDSINNAEKITMYNDLVSGNQTLKLFKELRDTNIHSKLVETIRIANNYQACSIIVRRSETTTEELDSFQNENESVNGDVRNEVKYYFDDSDDQQDILTLAQQYMHELEQFIKDARIKGLIE